MLENLHCFSLILSAIWRIDFIARKRVIVGQIWIQTKIKVSIGPQVCSSVFIRPLFCAPCTVHLCSFYPTDQEQPQVLPCPPRRVPTEGVASQRQQFPQSSLQWLHLLRFSLPTPISEYSYVFWVTEGLLFLFSHCTITLRNQMHVMCAVLSHPVMSDSLQPHGL